MTREEIEYRLKALLTMCDFKDAYGDAVDSTVYEEAVDMAIKALEEQKTGTWLIAEKDRYIVHSVRCSVCGYCISWMANYCPYCGAKMEVEQDD